MERRPLRLRPRASHPAVTRGARRGGDRPFAHWPGYYTFAISRTSKRCLPLHSCTLMSHVVRGGLHGDLLDPLAISCSASSATAPVRAGTSHTLLTRSPARPRSRTHTLPASLATSIAAHPLEHQLVLGVGNLLRLHASTSLVLQSTSSTFHRVGRPGASVKGTEILTGVLEATVRDPSRSGPGARLKYGLTHPRKRRRRRATRPHFHACEASPEGKQGAQIRRHTRVSKIRVRVAGTDSATVLGR